MIFLEGWAYVDAVIEELCSPNSTERLTSEKLVTVEKCIKEVSPSYVYSRQISAKKPFTENVRQAMTENVKKSARTSFLGNNDYKPHTNGGKFVNEDQQIFNFARSEVFKNASTQKPARLNETLASYMRSVGQIVCGSIQGTCFLVTDELVLTNYHVYRMIQKERNKPGNSNLTITVSFDYLHPGQTDHVHIVEIDEHRHPKLENPYLDYKFFYLKEGLTNRVPLGQLIRNWQLSDGRVIILGYPEGKEMQEEVCVVVGYRAMQETIKKRHEQCNGVHMTNAQLLDRTERYQGGLSYDTTLFSGSSGSPIFEMNGNIVAMHTQGYLLERTEANVSNGQRNVRNLEPQRNSRKYSLMEFGVQFISICRDMKQWHGENVVKQIFPNYKLKPGEETMEEAAI